MSIKLSERMKAIVDLCDKSECIVDIGTDHGLIPISLANNKMAKKIIAIDIKKAPIEACKKNIEKYLEDKNFDINAVVSDGLTDVDKNISLGIIITGMGFDSIVDILKNIEDYNYKYLIISPQTKINEFMKYANEMNFMIEKIKTIYEDDKMYLIFKCYNKLIWQRLYGDLNEN